VLARFVRSRHARLLVTRVHRRRRRRSKRIYLRRGRAARLLVIKSGKRLWKTGQTRHRFDVKGDVGNDVLLMQILICFSHVELAIFGSGRFGAGHVVAPEEIEDGLAALQVALVGPIPGEEVALTVGLTLTLAGGRVENVIHRLRVGAGDNDSSQRTKRGL